MVGKPVSTAPTQQRQGSDFKVTLGYAVNDQLDLWFFSVLALVFF